MGSELSVSGNDMETRKGRPEPDYMP